MQKYAICANIYARYMHCELQKYAMFICSICGNMQYICNIYANIWTQYASYFRLKVEKMLYMQKVAYLTPPDTPGGIRGCSSYFA